MHFSRFVDTEMHNTNNATNMTRIAFSVTAALIARQTSRSTGN